MKKSSIIFVIVTISVSTIQKSHTGDQIPEKQEAFGRSYLRRVDSRNFPEHHQMMARAITENNLNQADTILEEVHKLQAKMVKEKMRYIGTRAIGCVCVTVILYAICKQFLGS